MKSKHYNNNKFPKDGKDKTREKGEPCKRCGAIEPNPVMNRYIAIIGKKREERFRWICHNCYKELNR